MTGRAPLATAAALVALTILLGSPASRAGDPLLEERNPLISQAIEEYTDGNFEEAAKLLGRALRETHPTVEQKHRIYLYLGRSLAMLGRESGARKAFGRLLVLDPKAALPPDAHEDERYAFERALAKLKEERAAIDGLSVELQHTGPGAVVAGEAATLEATASGLPDGATITLYHTRSKNAPYSSLLMDAQDGGQYTAPIPTMAISETTEEYEIYYYIEVTDPSDEVLASAGADDAPLSFRVVAPQPEAEEEVPLWEEWWFWTAIGGGAAAALALGLGLGLGLEEPTTTGAAEVTIDLGR